MPNPSEILSESFSAHTKTYESAKLPLLKLSYVWSTPLPIPSYPLRPYTENLLKLIFRCFRSDCSMSSDRCLRGAVTTLQYLLLPYQIRVTIHITVRFELDDTSPSQQTA